MFDKLSAIEKTYLELQEQLYDPAIATDQTLSREVNKKLMSMQDAYDLFQLYKKADAQKKEAEDLLATESDTEMLAMAKEQLAEAQQTLPDIEEKLKVALIPKDPNDDKNIFLEIRPAAGGDEAGLFAAELLKAYMLYAQAQ
jgi:peptide chain release factor 1